MESQDSIELNRIKSCDSIESQDSIESSFPTHVST